MGTILLQTPQTLPPVAQPHATQPQATQAPVPTVPRTMAADDAMIAPFYTSMTQIIVSINFSRFDLPALREEENKAFASIVPAHDERLPQVRRSLEQINNHIEGASRTLQAQAGIHFYPMIAGTGTDNYQGFFVLPVAGEDVAAFDRLMNLAPARTADGNICLYGGKSTSLPTLARMLKAPKKQNLAAALGAGPDAALRVVVNPEFFGILTGGISTPRTLGLGNMSEPEWHKVKWLRMSIDAPPNLSGGVVLQCGDNDSAAALADLLKSKFTAIAANPPTDPLAARVAGLLADVTPTASGSQVTIAFDQKMMEAILVDWFVGVEYRPMRPPKGRPARPVTQKAGM
jgi:hypothetical protein